MSLKRRSERTKHPLRGKKHSEHKAVHIHPKHARPYRKRHLLGLVILLTLAGLLIAQVVWYFATSYQKQQDAKNASSTVAPVTPAKQVVTLDSQLGFKVTFDKKLYRVEASEVASDGSIHTFDEQNITQPRRYAFVEFGSKGAAEKNVDDPARMTIIVSQDSANIENIRKQNPGLDDQHVASKVFEERSDSSFEVVKVSEENRVINGQTYLKQVYLQVPRAVGQGNFKLSSTRTVVYSTLHNGHAYALKVSGITEGVTPANAFEGVINSFQVQSGAKTAAANYNAVELASKHVPQGYRSLASRLLGSEVASAAEKSDEDSKLSLVATYTPSTVKLYQLHCGRLVYLNKTVDEGCTGATGTGFIVSGDGYVATNGHVISSSAKDVVANSIAYGPDMLIALLKIEGYTTTQINNIIATLRAHPEQIGAVIAAVYKLSDQQLKFTNEEKTYLVALGQDKPDLEAFFNEGKEIAETNSIKKAKLVDLDYDSAELITGDFKHSDVAVLKLEGSDYPLTKLGNIDSLTQGAPLTVIGFPAAAENELTDNSTLKATATSGVVSAVKNSNDGKKKLVQSDVKIGHGNSGGPTFDKQGKVVGLATYSYASKDAEDGNISYIRDIQDFKDLLDKQKIGLNQQSKTQKIWEDGLKDFFAAHYTKAIKKFEAAKKQYPAHTLAAEYITISQNKIKNGEEASDPIKLILLVGGLAVVAIAIVVVIIIVVRHHGKHQVYKAMQGGATGPGVPPAAPPPAGQ